MHPMRGGGCRVRPFTTKPLISSVERLTSQNTKNPPGITIVLLLLLISNDPILDSSDMGRHLMRIEPTNGVGLKCDGTLEELTMREIGVIFPARQIR